MAITTNLLMDTLVMTSTSNPAMTKLAMAMTSMNRIAMNMIAMAMTAIASLPLAMEMNNTENQVMAMTSTINCENGRKETTAQM